MDYTTPNGRPLHDVVRAIASGLPDDWQTVDTTHEHAGVIVGPDGARMHVRLGTYGRESGRLIVSTLAPDNASYADGDTTGVDRPEATYAADRDPAVIARDITRRMLPGVAASHATMSSRIARRHAAESARETAARELATAMGGTAAQWRHEWRAEPAWSLDTLGGFTPSYDGTSVHVDMRSIPMALALELAAVIGRWETGR